jgi:hypothetical protein
MFVGKGRNGARVTTWVIGGLSLCCLGFGTINTAIGTTSFQGTGGVNGRDSAEVARLLEQGLPSWYRPVSAGLTGLSFICVLAVIILLALPASQPYFRKKELLWQPPVAGYPAQPGQPGAVPGQAWQQPSATPPDSASGPTGSGPTAHTHGVGQPGPNFDQPDQTDQWKPPSS